MTPFTLPSCTVRPWRTSDLESLLLHADNPRIAANLRDVFPSPYTRADGEAWLGMTEAHRTNFAIEVDGAAVGGIGLRLGEAYWGRGIVTEAVGALTRWGIEHFDLVRVDAHVFAPNVGSARVLEKNGYVLEGRLRKRVQKRGEILDALVYAFVVED